MQTKEQYWRLRPSALNQIIQKQDLKKYWLAEVAGVHKTTLRRWLNGSIEKAHLETVQRVAGVLTVAPIDIAEPLSG